MTRTNGGPGLTGGRRWGLIRLRPGDSEQDGEMMIASDVFRMVRRRTGCRTTGARGQGRFGHLVLMVFAGVVGVFIAVVVVGVGGIRWWRGCSWKWW